MLRRWRWISQRTFFEVAMASRAGRILDRKRLTRRQFERYLDELAPGTEVIMEACGTAHYWSRRCSDHLGCVVPGGRFSRARRGDHRRVTDKELLTRRDAQRGFMIMA